MSDDEDERGESSDGGEGEKGQYGGDSSDDEKPKGVQQPGGSDSDSDDAPRVSKKKKRSPSPEERSDDDAKADKEEDKEGGKEKEEKGSDSSDSEVELTKKRKKEKKKAKKEKKERKKKKKPEDGRRYIDDAADESDGEGGTKKNIDEDDDEDEASSDDDNLKQKKKRQRKAFIVDDDEMEEDEGVPKEKITITEREKKLDADDYDLLAENLGTDKFRPENLGDSSDDDDDDDGTAQRRRLKRGSGGRDDDDSDEEAGVKVSKEKGASALGKKLFSGSGKDDADDRDDGYKSKRVDMGDDSDSDLDDFIENDMGEDDDGGGGGASGKKKKKRRGGGGQMGADFDHAAAIFGEDFDLDDDDEDYEEEDGEMRRKKPAAEEVTLEELYEPAVIEEYYMSKEDDKIRKIDEPERLQEALQGRPMDLTVEELLEEARWMVETQRFGEWKDVLTGQVECTTDKINDTRPPDALVQIRDEMDTSEVRTVTKLERADILKGRLVKKVHAVLCYIRGVENAEIKHGPVSLEKEYGEDDPGGDWNEEKAATPMLDIPFIARYRQEYWRSELVQKDLWSILEYDGRWCELAKRKEALSLKFRNHGDDEAIQMLQKCLSDEDVSDMQAYYDLKYYVESQAEEAEKLKGLKKPVKVSKYRLCQDAKLGELAASFTIAAADLAENVERNYQGASPPDDPPGGPVDAAILAVPHAEVHGFRDASQVLNGTKYVAAKQIAFDPRIRKEVRRRFDEYALITVKTTKKGEDSAETYFHEMLVITERTLAKVFSSGEDFLECIKAKQEGLITTRLSMPPRDHEDLMGFLMKLYLKNPNSDMQASEEEKEWDRLRTEVLEEALKQHIYPLLEHELLNKKARAARVEVGQLITERLERDLRVAPYTYTTFSDSKALKPTGIMAICLGQPSEMVVIDKGGDVTNYLSIQLMVNENKNSKMRESDAKKITGFLRSEQPDVIVIGGTGLKLRTLKIQMEELVASANAQGHLQRAVEVLYSESNVAYKFAHSARASEEFPRYPAPRLQAVSLARRLQDPLREYSGMCAGRGDDILAIPLHHLQGMLDKAERLKHLHRAFINTVRDVGVDINLAADKPAVNQHTVQFVAGLGPRKAATLLQILRTKGMAYYREQLLEEESVRVIMRRSVWTNAAAFLKITNNSSMWDSQIEVGYKYDEVDGKLIKVIGGGGPLEGTRIHPESYNLANRIASDALEEEEGLDTLKRAMAHQNSGAMDDLDLEMYAAKLAEADFGKKNMILEDIRREMTNPFGDTRDKEHWENSKVAYDDPEAGLETIKAWEKTHKEVFNLLTGESEIVRGNQSQSSMVKTVQHVKVQKVLRRSNDGRGPPRADDGMPYKLITRLENGLMGTLDEEDFGDTDDDRFKFKQEVQEGQVISCVVMKVDYPDFSVKLSYRYSERMRYEAMPKKKEENKRKGVQYMRRTIAHPSFKNVSRAKAIELLKDEEAGEYVIRPSSAGLDKLAVTRKVSGEVFHDLVIQMEQQANSMAIGKKLIIDRMEFEDLDELIIGYLEPVAENDKKILGHEKFSDESVEKIKQILKDDKKIQTKSTTYLFGFNPQVPGTYLLLWLPGQNSVREEPVRCTPMGFRFRSTDFSSMTKMINWFKLNAHKQPGGDAGRMPGAPNAAPGGQRPQAPPASSQPQQPPPPPYMPPAPAYQPPAPRAPMPQAGGPGWGGQPPIPQQGGWGAPPPVVAGYGPPPGQHQWQQQRGQEASAGQWQQPGPPVAARAPVPGQPPMPVQPPIPNGGGAWAGAPAGGGWEQR